MKQITPDELNSLMDMSENLLLLDVREPWEFEICKIDGSENIPMNNIPDATNQFDKGHPIAVICHHGMRSLQVAHFLETRGFNNVLNLAGGIQAWTDQIDCSMERY